MQEEEVCVSVYVRVCVFGITRDTNYKFKGTNNSMFYVNKNASLCRENRKPIYEKSRFIITTS